MTKPTENELFEQWAIDYGLDWEPNFTRLDVETAWLSRAELADKEIAELQSQINELREALEEILTNDGGKYSRCYDAQKLYAARENAFQLIEKTPAQCLIQHDNEVIERCAKALENVEGELKYLPEYVSVIRKLKG